MDGLPDEKKEVLLLEHKDDRQAKSADIHSSFEYHYLEKREGFPCSLRAQEKERENQQMMERGGNGREPRDKSDQLTALLETGE